MRYIRVLWLHDHEDEPIELLSELDASSWEVRKVERFRNGVIGYADAVRSSRTTMLGLVPVPPLGEINQEPEFRATEIDYKEFEHAWTEAVQLVRT